MKVKESDNLVRESKWNEYEVNKRNAKAYIEKVISAVKIVNDLHAMLSPNERNQVNKNFSSDVIVTTNTIVILGEPVVFKMGFTIGEKTPREVIIMGEEEHD